MLCSQVQHWLAYHAWLCGACTQAIPACAGTGLESWPAGNCAQQCRGFLYAGQVSLSHLTICFPYALRMAMCLWQLLGTRVRHVKHSAGPANSAGANPLPLHCLFVTAGILCSKQQQLGLLRNVSVYVCCVNSFVGCYTSCSRCTRARSCCLPCCWSINLPRRLP